MFSAIRSALPLSKEEILDHVHHEEGTDITVKRAVHGLFGPEQTISGFSTKVRLKEERTFGMFLRLHFSERPCARVCSDAVYSNMLSMGAYYFFTCESMYTHRILSMGSLWKLHVQSLIAEP